MSTINTFVQRLPFDLRIAVSGARRVSARTDPEGWAHDAYRTRLAYRGNQLVTPFKKGIGHHGSPPSIEEVLNSLLMDDPRGESFEDWAANYGYDTDSRKALAMYEACVKQAKKARAFFGDEAYDALLECEGL